MTVGFLMAVIATVLVIVLAAPEYARPAIGAPLAPVDVAPSSSATVDVVSANAPTSKLPTQLRGYRWPVRGGDVVKYYDWDKGGQFSINGRRLNGGIDIEWFAGANVKAAHKGTVVAAGRDWVASAGFDGSVEALTSKKRRAKKKNLLEGVVIDDGNGYYSVYSNLKNLSVKKGQQVKAGTIIGQMSTSSGRQFMRYQLVRMDGDWLRVAGAFRKQGFPDYAHEYVDPLAVLNLDAKHAPRHNKRKPPADPPRLSEY